MNIHPHFPFRLDEIFFFSFSLSLSVVFHCAIRQQRNKISPLSREEDTDKKKRKNLESVFFLLSITQITTTTASSSNSCVCIDQYSRSNLFPIRFIILSEARQIGCNLHLITEKNLSNILDTHLLGLASRLVIWHI